LSAEPVAKMKVQKNLFPSKSTVAATGLTEEERTRSECRPNYSLSIWRQMDEIEN